MLLVTELPGGELSKHANASRSHVKVLGKLAISISDGSTTVLRLLHFPFAAIQPTLIHHEAGA
jgi:hypothetical protein